MRLSSTFIRARPSGNFHIKTQDRNRKDSCRNRWGEMLFESVGYGTPWDGRYNGGYVPVGTYYYVIKLNDPLFPDAYTGPLTVIR